MWLVGGGSARSHGVQHEPSAAPLERRPGFFEGGETMLLSPAVLDYWRNFDGSRGLEQASIVDRYDPQPFGRLLCFDGRVPHAVQQQ